MGLTWLYESTTLLLGLAAVGLNLPVAALGEPRALVEAPFGAEVRVLGRRLGVDEAGGRVLDGGKDPAVGVEGDDTHVEAAVAVDLKPMVTATVRMDPDGGGGGERLQLLHDDARPAEGGAMVSCMSARLEATEAQGWERLLLNPPSCQMFSSI